MKAFMIFILTMLIHPTLSYYISSHKTALEAKQPCSSEVRHIDQSRCHWIANQARRSKRYPKSDISIEPGAAPPPPNPPSNNDSNEPNTIHASAQQNAHSWTPTLGTILTAIFRAIITILSLLNVNITWRIHGTRMAPILRIDQH